jgi:hypothetical protein
MADEGGEDKSRFQQVQKIGFPEVRIFIWFAIPYFFYMLLKAVLRIRIRNRIRMDPKLLAGSGSDPEPKRFGSGFESGSETGFESGSEINL